MKPHELIKEKRLEKGYTQEVMANHLYIAKSTYNQYETGKRRMDIDTYQQIMAILGVKSVLEVRTETGFDFVLDNPNPLQYDVIAYSMYHCYARNHFEVISTPIRFYLVPKTFLTWAEGEYFEKSNGLFQEEIEPEQAKLTPLGILLTNKNDNKRGTLAYELTHYFGAGESKLADYLGAPPIQLVGELSPDTYKKRKKEQNIHLDVPTSTIFNARTWKKLQNGEFVFKAIDYCTHWDN